MEGGWELCHHMGDMADALIDELWDDEWEGEQEDWYEHLQTCKYCGLRNLWWVETERGWRLANKSGRIHTCKKYKSGAHNDSKRSKI